MYKNNRVVCIIPARGGSKRLRGKNIKDLVGKPLIAYSIEQAKESKYIDRVIVSTEDSVIAEVSKKYGAEVPFIRPKELATDESSVIDVLLHAIEWLEGENYDFQILVLLHVTTPLRDIEDIDRSIELLADTNADSIFSVAEAYRNPYFNMVEIDKDGKAHLVKKSNFVTRQSAPQVFDMNSSIYVWWKNTLKKNKKTISEGSKIYIMPKERSVDIDDMIDFNIAEMLLKEKISNV